MRIGIFTFHRAENFGAVLQCFALQELLESLGHKVEIVDYRCRNIERGYYVLDFRNLFCRLNIFASFSNLCIRIPTVKDRIVKKRKYIAFRKQYLHLSQPISRGRDLGYDIYITGSDQVWNTILLHGYDETYFLDFALPKSAKRISYAVSSEQNAIAKLYQYKTSISAVLNQFDSISVREQTFADELKKISAKDVQVCVDPTFFLSIETYLKMAIKPQINNYILVYHMAEVPEASSMADFIAYRGKKKVIEIHAKFESHRQKERHKQDVGPLDLLGYIAYADYVITTSFHGLALSLILQKNFCVVSKPGNMRLQNILREVGLEDRLITKDETPPMDTIDYRMVSSRLIPLIEKSRDFLITAIEK